MAMDYFNPRVIDGTGMILDTTPGSPDTGSYVTEDQLKNWIKAGILFDGYYYNGNFYSDSGHTSPLAKVEGALYVDKTNVNKALYVCLSSTYQSLTEEAQVQAIIDGLNDGTIVPLKAKQDQNGNVIDLTYETKADANDLKNACEARDSALNKRVTNLEQKAGGYSVVNYRGTNAVPTGKAEYAMVESIVGKSRGWNQFGRELNSTYWGFFGSTGSFSDGVVTFTAGGQYGNMQYGTSYRNIPILKGHVYLLYGEINLTSATTYVRLALTWNSNTGESNINTVAQTGWQTLSKIIDFTGAATSYSDGNIQIYDYRSGSFDAIKGRNIILRDLTLIFGSGNEPSTVAEAVALCPSILEYDAYGYSLVDTVVEGVESGYIRIGQYEQGSYTTIPVGSSYTGSKTDSTTRIRSTSPIKITSGLTFTVTFADTNYDISPLACDADGLGVTPPTGYGGWQSSPITLTSAGSVLLVIRKKDNSTITPSDISNLNLTITLGIHDELTLPTPVTLRSAGNGVNEVRDELDVESGVLTENVVKVDMSTDLTWTQASSGGNYFYYSGDLMNGVAKYPTSSYSAGSISCSNRVNIPASSIVGSSGSVAIDTDGTLYCTPPVATTPTAPSGILTYAKATPTTGTSIGTANPMLATEGGGTINTKQTQTTQIDNCMDVGYLAV